MKPFARMIMAGVLLAGSAQVQAAEWWCVLGAPDAAVARFVDTDTAAHSGDRVEILVVRIDATGTARQQVEQVRCRARPASPDAKALRDFACGSIDYRMSNGVILGSMTPLQAAHVIFTARDTAPHLVQAKRPGA